MKPDAHDLIGTIGVVMIGAGLWLRDPTLALIVVGAILLILGVLTAQGGNR